MPNGVISYRGGAGVDLSTRGLKIHKFLETGGPERITVPDHALLLVESDVTSTEIWAGVSQGQRDWIRGDVAFLPAGSDLKSTSVSRAYDESVLRLKVCAVAAAAEVDLPTPDLRFLQVPREDVIGIASSLVNLAHANRDHRAVPMLIESLEQALCVSVACTLAKAAGAAVKPLRNGLSGERRRRCLDFIEANLDKPLTLADIANAAAMSPYHFARSFRAAMGVTPVRYVWERRIALARQLLRNPGMPIAEVAMACGFSGQSHFTTAFRQATGLTPAAFRKTIVGALVAVMYQLQKMLPALEAAAGA